jgi:hypothetical protein
MCTTCNIRKLINHVPILCVYYKKKNIYLVGIIVLTLSKNARVGLNNTDTLNASGLTTSLCPAVIFVFANLSITNTDNCLSSGTFVNTSGNDSRSPVETFFSYSLSKILSGAESPNLNNCCIKS